MIYGHEPSSTARRATIVTAETVLAAVALWILLLGGIDVIDSRFGFRFAVAPLFRRLVLFLFVVLTYVRMTTMITVLLKRSIGWEEAIAVPFAFLLYYVVFSPLGGFRDATFGALDVAALALFAIGAVYPKSLVFLHSGALVLHVRVVRRAASLQAPRREIRRLVPSLPETNKRPDTFHFIRRRLFGGGMGIIFKGSGFYATTTSAHPPTDIWVSSTFRRDLVPKAKGAQCNCPRSSRKLRILSNPPGQRQFQLFLALIG
jgi:hypothetical protein